MIPSVLVALVTLASAGPSAGPSPGLSARLVPLRAVEGEPLPVVVEVDDATRAVGGVRIEVRTATGGWSAAPARLDGIEGRWRAELPARMVPPAGQEVAVRASILGARGGLLLDLGFDEPMTAVVLGTTAARAEDRVLRSASTRTGDPLDSLVAYVGAEGRLGSGARARLLLSVGAALTARQELVVGLAMGPAFSRPDALGEGGVFVLGFEVGWRVFAREPRFSSFAPYAELGAAVDLRLPGVDPGLAARVGASLDLGVDIRLDLSVGGGPVIFAASEDASIGFVGGGRLALRFGGAPGS